MTRSPAGRPAHVPTDETRNLVESLSGFGIPQDEIARLVGIDPKTLRFHYADQIELGSIKATAKVVNSLPTVTPFSRPIVTPLGGQEWAYPRSAQEGPTRVAGAPHARGREARGRSLCTHVG